MTDLAAQELDAQEMKFLNVARELIATYERATAINLRAAYSMYMLLVCVIGLTVMALYLAITDFEHQSWLVVLIQGTAFMVSLVALGVGEFAERRTAKIDQEITKLNLSLAKHREALSISLEQSDQDHKPDGAMT
jgi:hypothetical protein